MTSTVAAPSSEKPSIVLRGGLLSAVDQGLVSGCSFLTVAAVGRASGVDGLGAYALALSVMVTASVAQGALLTKSYINLHRSSPEPRSFAGGTMWLQIAFALTAGGLLGLTAAASSWAAGPPELTVALACAAAATPWVIVRDWLRQYLFAHLELGRVLAFDSVWVTLQTAMLVWLYLAGRLSPGAAFGAMAGAAAVTTLVAWLLLRKRFDVSIVAARGTWRQSARFGSWTALSELCQQSRVHLIQGLLALVQGLEATGAFAAAMALVRALNPLLLALSNFSEPYLAKSFHAEGGAGVRKLAPRIALGMLALVSPLCAAIAWSGPSLIQAIFGGGVQVDGLVFAYLLAAAVVGLLIYPFSASLYAAGMPRLTLEARSGALVLGLVAAAALIPSMGAQGAALSVLLGALTAAWLLLTKFLRALRPWQRESP